MNWQKKKVLVTGAGGFLGSHLTEALVTSGAQVRTLVHYNSRNDWGLLELLPQDIKGNLEVVAGDLTDPFGMTRLVAGCDVVFHLAALIGIPYSYVAPAHYVAVNVTGTLNLLEAARTQGVEAFIHTSTSETYGTAAYTPMDEGHPLKGQSPYSASKIAADKLVESYYCSFGLPAVTVRPFNAFGPRQSARAVIPTIITQALAGDTIHLGNTRAAPGFHLCQRHCGGVHESGRLFPSHRAGDQPGDGPELERRGTGPDHCRPGGRGQKNHHRPHKTQAGRQ